MLKSPLVLGSILVDRFAILDNPVDLALNEATFNDRVNDDLFDRLPGLPSSMRRAPVFVPPSTVGGES